MLRILGNPKKLCDGLTRRDMSHAGGLGLMGLGLNGFFRLQESQASQPAHRPLHAHFGKAKSCILLFLYGSPSQLELADQKPDAPVEIRGELKSIRSTLPGLRRLRTAAAHVAASWTTSPCVRSVTHKYPIHGVAYATTGVPDIDVAMELSPHDGRHWPFIGSVVVVPRAAEEHAAAMRSRCRTTSPCPGRSAASGPARCSGPARTPRSSATPTTRSAPRSAARPPAKITKTLTDSTIEFDEPYVGHHARLPTSRSAATRRRRTSRSTGSTAASRCSSSSRTPGARRDASRRAGSTGTARWRTR